MIRFRSSRGPLPPAAFLFLVAAAVAGATMTLRAGESDAVDHALAPGLWEAPTAQGTIAQITVPFLHSPEMERRCGKPRLTVVADGSYVLRYQHPTNRSEFLEIVGTRRPVPPIRDASGNPSRLGTIEVLGQRVPYYVAGNEDPEILTPGLVLTAPGGKKANYVIHAGGKETWAKKQIPKLSW